MDIATALRALGLTPSASLQEAKTAYRKLAKTWHPDRAGGGAATRRDAEEKMKKLNAAYRVVTRFLNGKGTSTRNERTPWWWREEEVPPASARAIRRPPWFRGFAFGDPSRYRDDLWDYVGAMFLVGMGLYLLATAALLWTSWRFSFLLGFATLLSFKLAVQAIRDEE